MTYDQVREGLLSGGWDTKLIDELLPGAFGDLAAAAASTVAGAASTIAGAAKSAADAVTPPAAQPAQPPAYAPPTSQPVSTVPAYGGTGLAAGNTSGGGPGAAVPAEVENMGWSWGGFGLNWIWAIVNKTWIGLLALIPCVNIFIAIWLGLSGHKMAWQNRRFDSLTQFQETMKAWNLWGLVVFLISIALNVLSFIIRAATDR